MFNINLEEAELELKEAKEDTLDYTKDINIFEALEGVQTTLDVMVCKGTSDTIMEGSLLLESKLLVTIINEELKDSQGKFTDADKEDIEKNGNNVISGDSKFKRVISAVINFFKRLYTSFMNMINGRTKMWDDVEKTVKEAADRMKKKKANPSDKVKEDGEEQKEDKFKVNKDKNAPDTVTVNMKHNMDDYVKSAERAKSKSNSWSDHTQTILKDIIGKLTKALNAKNSDLERTKKLIAARDKIQNDITTVNKLIDKFKTNVKNKTYENQIYKDDDSSETFKSDIEELFKAMENSQILGTDKNYNPKG